MAEPSGMATALARAPLPGQGILADERLGALANMATMPTSTDQNEAIALYATVLPELMKLASMRPMLQPLVMPLLQHAPALIAQQEQASNPFDALLGMMNQPATSPTPGGIMR